MKLQDATSNRLKMLLDPRNFSAWVVLVICLSLTAMAWYATKHQIEDDAQRQFRDQTNHIVSLIESRLHQHEQILLGGAGLFDSSKSVSRAEWHTYIERLNLQKNYPGIQGVGYSQIIQPRDLASHIATVRAEGFPNYTVHPVGQRPVYTSIIYLEPFSGRNMAAFGFDMMSEKTRAQGLRQAVESGETTITGRVTLVQETHGKVQAGFLMYLPIYRHQHPPLHTPEQRWKSIRGFVYSPFRVDDLMNGIMDVNAIPIEFNIYDGNAENPDALLYSSLEETPKIKNHHHKFNALRHIKAYGRTWLITLRGQHEFEEMSNQSSLEITIVTMGISISILLFALISLQIFRRDRAEQLAQKMTLAIRRNEDKLRRSEAHLAEGQRIAKLGSWELDIAHQKENWSDEMFHLLETNKKQTTASFGAYLTFVHEEDREALQQTHARALTSRQPVEIIHRLVMHDGKIKWVQENFGYEFNAAGKHIRSRGTIQDITESKLARLALQASEQRLHMALAASRSALWDANLLTGQIVLDASWATMLGEEPHETTISFENLTKLVPADEAPHVQQRMVSVLKNESESYWAEHRVKHHQGHWIWIESRGSVVARNAQGKAIRMIGTNTDITERKRIDQMKSEFVSTVSHELRTPLTSISGALGLVSGGVTGELPEKAKQMIDLAYKNSVRLSHLINDLLDMEKLSVGKMRFDLRIQPLMPLIEQALEVNRAYATQYQVKFMLTAREDVQVHVDAMRLQQVLSNFLSNAAKFSPKDAQVELAVRRLDNKVRVEVIDHGSGVPEEFHDRIFQKFSQADSSDTRQKGGTGLGLAISKELIEHMHGSIGFESTPGQGACFYFELPL